MNTHRMKKLETKALMALAFGASAEHAALQSGVSERTIYRRLRDPEFKSKIAEMRSDTR